MIETYWQMGMTLEDSERRIIESCLAKMHGNKTKTAQMLGIAIRTLDNKLALYAAPTAITKNAQAQMRRKIESAMIHFFQDRQKVAQNCGISLSELDEKLRSYARMDAESTEGEGKTLSEGMQAGVRMESSAQSSEELPVPMRQQEEVQSVLPKQTARGNSRVGGSSNITK